MTVPLLDAATARAADADAVANGATWVGLMERAGGHLARDVMRFSGRGYGLRVAIAVGKGDNGGDGWVAARRLAVAGAQAWVIAVHGADVTTSTATAAHRAAWLGAGGRTGGPGELAAALAWADVAVDALLGTGSAGAPRGVVADACRALHEAHLTGLPVVACDVPSGVASDTGAVAGDVVRADLTVTFGAWKRGLLLHPGAAFAGRVVVADLGPGWSTPRPPTQTWHALTAGSAHRGELAVHADKRARGTVVVVAGQVGMGGAAMLATRGAVNGGAGLVTAAVPDTVREEVAGGNPSAMTLGLRSASGALAADAFETLAEVLARADVVVAGPGLGTSDGVRATVAALRGWPGTLVLDADAINVHRDDAAALADHAGALVLTPHEREFARICGVPDPALAWEQRCGLAPDLAVRLDATVVIKGPGTLIAAPDGRVWVTPTGSPALGTGGTGDVLAGLVGAFVARVDDVPLAVARACWVHGLAGEIAAEVSGGRPDSEAVAAALPAALERTRRLAAERPGWPLEHRAAEVGT